MKTLVIVALLVPFASVMAQETNANKQLPEELAPTTSIVMQDADELETSVAFDQYKYSHPSSERKSTVAVEFQYGLTDRWEIDAEVPYRFRDFNHRPSFNGIGDVEAGRRYGVIPINKGPVALDVGLALGIPTGDRKRDLGEGRVTLEPSFTASTWFGPVNTQLNCAWDRAISNAGDAPRDEFLYNVAILYLVGRCVLALEGNGISTRDATEYYVTPELIWNLTKRLEFRVAAPIGVTRTAADYGIVVSVTLELDNIAHRGADKV